MSITAYNKKRNFKKTQEPRGTKVSPSRAEEKKFASLRSAKEALTFVIHEHDASHHHFDLRLEYGGVLKSWALPKTLSTDPAVKRMAVEVEDHPLAYGVFEGTIPEGEYGAGHVKIWDSGEWTNESNFTIEQSFKKGHLHFRLSGKRLTHTFHLVRTKKKNQWLIFAASEQSSPTIPRPQLATISSKVALPAVIEPKLDGYRVLAVKGSFGKISLFTRNGHDWTHKFPTILDSLTQLPLEQFVFDGELTYIKGLGLSFHDLQKSIEKNRLSNVNYFIFDLLKFDQTETKHMPLIDRKILLQRLADVLAPPLFLIDSKIVSEADELKKILVTTKNQRYEGIIAKKPDGIYLDGQRKDWYKIKWLQSEEFIVVGYTHLKDDPRSIGALLLAEEVDGSLEYRGKVGTGFSSTERRQLLTKLKSLEVSADFPPRLKTEPRQNYIKIKPQFYAQVHFQNRTPDGHLRAPTFIGIRSDKTYQPVLNISHPTKKYFSDGTSKSSFYQYYQKAATHMLPYFSGQHISVLRCPDGADSQCFFQKNANSKKSKTPLAISTVEDILKWAEQSAFEFHIHSKGYRTQIDHLVFDLDPGPKVRYIDLKKVVTALYDLLTQLSLPVFIKTSGRKGFHLCVPLKKGLRAERIERFSLTIAQHIVGLLPNLATVQLSKIGREDKVLIDYLRNKKSATFVAPYSVRKHDQPTVSAPLNWSDYKKSRNLPVITIYDDIDTAAWRDYFNSAVDLKKSLKKG